LYSWILKEIYLTVHSLSCDSCLEAPSISSFLLIICRNYPSHFDLYYNIFKTKEEQLVVILSLCKTPWVRSAVREQAESDEELNHKKGEEQTF
jgi:hypothetical protein